MPKLKNILIFVAVAVGLVLIYVLFIKPSLTDNAPALVTSTPITTGGGIATSSASPAGTQDFLTLLLSVKNIRLDDTVLSDNTFTSLHDSSISLVPDGTEGRPNPFAPLGSENIVVPPVVGGTAGN